MIGYVIFGLLFVLLLVFGFLTARNWHWSSIVLLVLSYIAAVACAFGAAKSLHLRQEALQANETAMKRRADAAAELSRSRYGEPTALTYGPDSLYGVEEALKLKLTGRGRVWMNGTVEDSNGNRLYKFPAARDAADPNIGQLNNILLYAFLDDQVGPLSYPSRFLGVFRASDEKADSLLLTPELIVSPDDYAAAGTWSLYEKMPSDRFEIFPRQKADGSGEMSITEYRTELENTWMPAEALGMERASAEYERLIDQFAFDGRSIGEIERWVEENAGSRISQRFVPDPEEVLVRYKFNKPSSQPYTVDGQGNLETDGPYTLLGEAIDPGLKLGKQVEFKADDEVLVDLPNVNGYQASEQNQIAPFSQREDVTEVDRVYRRRLFDFPSLFADLRRQSADFVKRTATVTLQNEVQARALADAQGQITYRDEDLRKLQADNANLQKDMAEITRLLEARRVEFETMKQEVADLQRRIEAQRRQRDGEPVASR